MPKKLPIIYHPDEKLSIESESFDVSQILQKDQQTIFKDMLYTMKKHKGVGIAAPQIGVLKRFCYVSNNGRKPQLLINPVITKRSSSKEWAEEGCLSIPNVYGQVERNMSVTVEYVDTAAEKQELSAEGFLARVIQHEIDHLDGVLFIDKAKDIYESGI